MRWESLLLEDGAASPPGSVPGATEPAVLPLLERGAVQRRFDTPEFRGMTFFEVQARSVLNRVPAASRMPFRWTVNPYRGCSHACVYCFARQTHTYLDLDAGVDFDSKVVVKVNAAQSLRRELARPSWAGEHVAMGTNVDPYHPTTAIVEGGPYAYTRNPLYVGMALIYAGVSARANALPAALLLPVVLHLVDRSVIKREERYLEGKFGDEYLRYKGRVRRWI